MMPRRLLPILVIIASHAFSVCVAGDVTPESLRLTLPPMGYAVAGSEMNVYFDNIVLTESPEKLKFVVSSDLGATEERRWTALPTEADVGVHQWKVEVLEGDRSLAKSVMSWRVSPAKVKQPRELTLLIVGDSLTHATIYPNDLAKRLEAAGITKWNMLGTHRPGNASEGVAHEGYGGWTWQRFAKHFDPNSNLEKRLQSSPFVFREGETPAMDVKRYFREACQGRIPDYIVILLGTNDCFGADPNNIAKTDQTIDTMLSHADTLLTALHDAAPNARIGVCLTPAGNTREAAFEKNYQGRYPRWGWKRIQHRLTERQLSYFGGAEPRYKFLDIVPAELNIDPIDGYPDDNAVHPNETGYQQLAASIHAWLMSRLTE